MENKDILDIYELFGFVNVEYIIELSEARLKGMRAHDDILLEVTGTDASVAFPTEAKSEEDFPVDSEAKIIPLNNEYSSAVEELEADSNDEIEAEIFDENNELNKAGIYSHEQIEERLRKLELRNNKKKKSPSVFILDEKKKIKKSSKKMSEIDAMKAYFNSSSNDLNPQSSHEDEDVEVEEVFNDCKGILINKKQF